MPGEIISLKAPPLDYPAVGLGLASCPSLYMTPGKEQETLALGLPPALPYI